MARICIPPRVITGNLRVVVPVTIARHPADHRINHAGPAQCRSARIVNPQKLRARRRAALSNPVPPLRCQPGKVGVLLVPGIPVGVVLDEEVPVDIGRVDPESPPRALVSGFDEKHRVPCLCKIGGDDAAAGTASDYYIVVLIHRSSRRGGNGAGGKEKK